MSRTAPADHAAQRAVLDRVGSLEREQAVLYARQARARAELAGLFGADQGVYAELAGTARIGQGRAAGQLTRAERLVGNFPIALGLLELGVMRVGTVEIVLELTKNARPEVQHALDERLSERLCSMDAVDVRRLVARTLLEVEGELDEAAQRERHERARANRGVWAFPVEDGMARIGAELDQVTARRWVLDFDELVRAQKVLDDRDGVVRTQAQRRADVFALLPSRLLGFADAAVKGQLGELQAQVVALRQQAGADQARNEPADEGSEAKRAERLAWLQAQAALMREDAGREQTEGEPCARPTSGAGPSGGEPVDVDVDRCPVPVPLPSPRGCSDTPALLDADADADASAEAEVGDVAEGAVLPCGLSREDALLDLLRLPVRNPVTLYLHTAMTTMLDLDQRSGWLEGIGPVPALHARMLLPTATLRRVAVDERTGVPLGLDPHVGVNPPWRSEADLPPRHRRRQRHCPDPAAAPPEQVLRQRLLTLLAAPMYLTDRAEPQHDPSTALRTLARLRDQTCDGPGCPRNVSGCELDHEIPYAEGGQTAIWNLKHRSPRCHHCKHDGWVVTHDHESGVSDWTSPAGSHFTRESPWEPPVELPEGLQLPEPRLEQPRDLTPDRGDAESPDSDRPLWRDPEPPQPRERRARRQVWDPAKDPIPPWHQTAHSTADDPPTHAPPPTSWDDGGPPPF